MMPFIRALGATKTMTRQKQNDDCNEVDDDAAISIREAHTLQARHGAVDGIVRPSHEDIGVECHSRPCPGGGDFAHSTCWMR
jgi:hypothetical protein